MNESLVKYLAGLLDADGSLSFAFKADENRPGRCYIGLHLGLASSEAVDKTGFIDNLPQLTGMGSVSRYGDLRQFKTWAITKRSDLEMLLPRLIKHMVIKARHWQWLLDTWRIARAEGKTCSLAERVALTEASRHSRKFRTGPIRPKNHPTWAWLAGYLDGDGWYSYRRSSGQWHILVGACAHVNDAESLRFIQRAFGGQIKPQGQSDNVMVWNRSLGYQNRSFALRFLPNVAKHSRLKRHKIDAIIHHHRQRLSVPGCERRYCEIDDCDKPRHGNGMCSLHYQREWKSRKRQSETSIDV